MTAWAQDWAIRGGRLLWPVWPALFIVAVWSSSFKNLDHTGTPHQTRVASRIDDSAGVLVQALRASSHHDAWLLGVIAGKLTAGSITEDEASTHSCAVLHKSSAACDSDSAVSHLFTSHSILQLGQLYDSREMAAGVLSRVAGVLTFANMMWICGAVGMAITFFPMVRQLVKPLIPLMLTAHYLATPFHGLLCYALCLNVILAAERYDADVAPFIALTGVLLAVATYVMLGRQQRALADDSAPQDVSMFCHTILVFALLTCAPLTKAFASPVLGLATALSLFMIISHSLVPLCMGWSVWGREQEDWTWGRLIQQAMWAVRAISVLSVLLHVVGAAVPPVERAARPYRLGFACFGHVAVMLLALVRSSRFWWLGDKEKKWFEMNWRFVMDTATVVITGGLVHSAALVQAGGTFLVLWLAEKGLERPVLGEWQMYFLRSVAMVLSAAFLKYHPGWIMSMLVSVEAAAGS